MATSLREKFDLWVKKVGRHRGNPRLWFDTPRIEKAGLTPGVRFSVTNKGAGIQIARDDAGSFTVSSKTRNGRTIPVVDINNGVDLAVISEHAVVRIIVRADCVWVLPLASELAKRERINRLIGKLARGEALASGSLAHGVGVAAHAAHQGLSDLGIETTLAFASEIDEVYASQSVLKNDAAQQACMLVAPMQELVQDQWVMDQIPKVELLSLGLPCSGASLAGKARNGNKMMESHPEVGHLVYAALAIIQRAQPVALALENVVGYASSASAEILRLQLRDMGYHVVEVVLDAQNFGCIENRERWFLCAYTDGLECSVQQLLSLVSPRVPKLGELLEDVPLDAACWSELKYLRDKETRDLAAGKGFKMQVVNSESTKVGVLRKQYAKGGSTDPFVQHPVNPALLRKFSVKEHARIKAIPPVLLEDVSETIGHQMAGQSVAYEQVRALYRECIGPAIVRLRDFGAKLAGLSAVADRLDAVIG